MNTHRELKRTKILLRIFEETLSLKVDLLDPRSAKNLLTTVRLS